MQSLEIHISRMYTALRGIYLHTMKNVQLIIYSESKNYWPTFRLTLLFLFLYCAWTKRASELKYTALCSPWSPVYMLLFSAVYFIYMVFYQKSNKNFLLQKWTNHFWTHCSFDQFVRAVRPQWWKSFAFSDAILSWWHYRNSELYTRSYVLLILLLHFLFWLRRYFFLIFHC
jgi:hypothetical protein